ncbi:MAG: hypothetical protein V4620_03115 [Bacteroidota bacterium]
MESNYVSLKDIVNFIKKIYKFSLSKWKLFFLIGLLGGLLGYTFVYIQKPKYIAKFSFLLNENDGSPSLNLSSLAGLAGIGGIGGGGNINDDKLLFISFSRNLLGKTLLDTSTVNAKKTYLANHYLDIYGLTNSFKSDTLLKDFTYFTNGDINKLTYKENKVLDILINKIIESKQLVIESKKKSGIVSQSSGIVTIEFSSIHENFSKNFTDNLYDNISSYYINKSISKQLKTYNAIKNRADSIKSVLMSLENYGAQIFDKNLKVIRMQGRVNIERTRRDVEMLSLMYAEVIKNQEIAKFSLDNQTPFFQIVDRPTLPLFKKQTSKLIAAIVGSIVLTLLVLFGTFTRTYYSSQNEIDE